MMPAIRSVPTTVTVDLPVGVTRALYDAADATGMSVQAFVRMLCVEAADVYLARAESAFGRTDQYLGRSLCSDSPARVRRVIKQLRRCLDGLERLERGG